MLYLIEDILPAHRVHLLAGDSDAGKTRFMLPMLCDWAKSKLIGGHASHPVPWAYVVGDRMVEEACETISEMKIPQEEIRVVPGFGRHNKTFLQVLLAIQKLNPMPELLAIEGFGDYTRDSLNRFAVREFLSMTSTYCIPSTNFKNGLTILGVMESPKQKATERYANPRQRVSGCASWGYHTSTVIVIEQDDPKGIDPTRTIYFCMKNRKRFHLKGHFDSNGRLVTDAVAGIIKGGLGE